MDYINTIIYLRIYKELLALYAEETDYCLFLRSLPR